MRRLIVGLALGLGAALTALAAGQLPFVDTVVWKLYDQHVRWAADPSAASPDILVVEVDEKSIRQLEPAVGRWPWPRLVHGFLIDYLARGPARVVVYDVSFTDRDRRSGFAVGADTWTGVQSDRAFADSVAKAGNVVMLADATFEGLTEAAPRAGGADPAEGGVARAGAPAASLAPAGDPAAVAAVDQPDVTALAAAGWPADPRFESRPVLTGPYAELARATRALGHNFLALDADGPVRRAVPFVRRDAVALPSLPFAAVLVARGLQPRDVAMDASGLRLGTEQVPLMRTRVPEFTPTGGTTWVDAERLLIDFRGPAVLADGRSTVYRSFSFYDLFYSEQQLLAGEPPQVDPALFRDRIVVVGVTASGLHDVFAVPFTGGGKMTGAQIHASVIDQLLASRFVRPAPISARLVAVLLAALLAAGLVLALRLRLALPAAALLVVLLGVGAQWLFRRGLWLSAVEPMLAVALATFGGVAWQYFVEGREKRLVKRLFSRYLSRDVYDQLLANPGLADLGGKKRVMTVLFSDLRGFTTFTERGQPEAVVEQLNEYFSRMVDVLFANRGTLDKFVGDMVMALFGAPLDDPDHADHAVQTALQMTTALAELNRGWAAQGRPQLAVGIGINSGEMIAGNIGSEQVRSYTVIGDAVNQGSRLESLTKDKGAGIIVSAATVASLKGQYDIRPLGSVMLKGKQVPVDVYEVRPPASGGPPSQEGQA